MRYSTIAALLTALTFSLSAPAAWACMDFEALSPNESTLLLSAAEKELKAGHPQKVVELLAYSPDLATWQQNNKRMELVAIAQIRLGKVHLGNRALKALLKKSPDDPYLLARLAEGLVRTRSGKAEALAILERLDREDLMPDAEGYAVLAALLPAGPAAAKATARCEQLAADKTACAIKS